MKEYLAFLKQYYPDGNPADMLNVYGYNAAQTMVYVLQRCGDDLSRENVLKQATSISNLELPMLLPGIKINTSATDYFPIEQMQLQRFDGKRWLRFGQCYWKLNDADCRDLYLGRLARTGPCACSASTRSMARARKSFCAEPV